MLPVDAIRLALAANDASQLAKAIEALIEEAPGQWVDELLWMKEFPTPVAHSPKLDTIHTLVSVAVSLLQSTRISAEDRVRLLGLATATGDLSERALAIADLLGELQLRPSKEQILYALAVSAQEFASMAHTMMVTHATRGAALNHIAMLESCARTTFGDTPVAPDVAWNAHSEAVATAAKYVLWKLQDEPWPTTFTFETSSLSLLDDMLPLAQLWNTIKGAWEQVRFCNWSAYADDISVVYHPLDEERYRVDYVGQLRREQWISDLTLGPTYTRNLAQRQADRLRQIEGLAATTRNHSESADWLSNVNIVSFRKIVASSLYPEMIDLLLTDRHAQTLKAEVALPASGHTIGWDEVARIATALRELASLAATESGRGENEIASGGGPKALRVMPSDQLQTFLANVCDVTPVICRDVVSYLTLKTGESDFDAFATGLWPIGLNAVLMLPSLVLAGEPLRLLEHCVTASSGRFEIRSTSFQHAIADEFRRNGVEGVDEGVKLWALGQIVAEADVVVHWQGFLFVIEAKCLRSVGSAADSYRAYKTLTEGASQARRYVDLLPCHWDQFKERSQLPNLPPSATDLTLVPIVVSTLFAYSGLSLSGVPILDDALLRIFFDSAFATVVTADSHGAKHVAPIARIRQPGGPTASAFAAYASDPAPVRMFRDNVSLQPTAIPGMRDGQPPLIFPVPVFEKDLIGEALQRVSADDNAPPRLQVRRNEPCPCGSGLKFKKCCLR